MSTATTTAPEVAKEAKLNNLREKISAGMIASSVKPYQSQPIGGKLERGVPLEIIVKAFDPNDLENTVIFENPALNQEITMKRFASFFVAEDTEDEIIMVGEDEVLPLGKGKLVSKVINEKGLPLEFEIIEREVCVGAKPGIVEKSSTKELDAKIYAEFGIDPTQEDFPLLIPRNKKDMTNPENYRKATVVMVKLTY